ncbi:MAG: glycoside hydrolase family 3 C-terminal domain-containing protein [Bacteroidaceae bacterium]|nr:glycoside hydrolase family 3 C-terminal domain-containing protein [Bacteroidaceae bacterium]
MKNLCAVMAASVLCIQSMAQIKPAIPRDEQIEAQVESKLAQLTLDEKIGQMMELTVDVVTDFGNRQTFTLSEEALQKAFDHYKVGSILNVPFSLAQPPAVWAQAIRQMNRRSMEQCNGIPQIMGVDQNHGTTYTWGGTLFPQEINMAASFNRDIPRRVGEITAYESRACLIPWVYNPVMDLGRQPLWSRMWESFGEDTYVNAEMGVAFTKGYQGEDPNHIDNQHVAVSLKHYMGYGVPFSGKDRTPAFIPERELRERYFEPYRRCIEAGALTVMVNSGVINGISTHANKKLLTEWLKEELNWDGLIVTDWADIDNLWKRDHVAATKKEAIALAINAGIDMSMDPYDLSFCDLLKECVHEGLVPQERIDDAVRRILRLKYRIGLFDTKTWDIDTKKLAKQYPKFGSDEFAAEATKMAEECIVLLKNEQGKGTSAPILPLKQGMKLLCVGPNADNFRPQNGGWSYSWQGHLADSVCRTIGKYHTFYSALAKKFGTNNVLYNSTLTYQGKGWQDEQVDIEQTKLLAEQVKACDAIIAFIGENSYCETPGNINDLTLSEKQTALVKKMEETGKPVILVLNEGRPRIITSLVEQATAIIDVMLPSNYGGEALANLMAGEANFSAKLPFTYPKYTGSFATYDYKPCQQVGTMSGNYNYDAKVDEMFPFGYGMSYTTFKYSNLTVNRTTFKAGDELTFTVDVTNTGERAGKEAVLLYVSDLVASITPDNKRLRAFEKIALQPGETQTVTFTLPSTDLAFVGIDNEWVLEKGDFRATCGNQSVAFRCDETKKLGISK